MGTGAWLTGFCLPLPEGFAASGGDCNDANALVFPGALGSGEGIDNDCNGAVEGLEMVNCLADLNVDGQVSVADVLLLLGSFGCLESCNSDLDGDGSVAVSDLLYVLVTFGTTC